MYCIHSFLFILKFINGSMLLRVFRIITNMLDYWSFFWKSKEMQRLTVVLIGWYNLINNQNSPENTTDSIV